VERESLSLEWKTEGVMDDDSGELVKEEVAGIARGELEPATVNLEVHSPVTLCTSGSSRWCLISHEFGSAP